MINLSNPFRVIFFLFSKIIIFISVLLFQIFGFENEYIFLEKNLASALFLLNFFLIGTTTSYANAIVVRKVNHGHSLMAVHANIAMTISFLLLIISLIIQSINYVFIFSCILCMIGTKQLSQNMKNKNNVVYSSFFDAIFYYFLVFSFVLMFLFDNFLDPLVVLVIVFFIYIFTKNVKKISTYHRLRKENFKKFYDFAIKSLNITFICSLFVLAPRALVDTYINPEMQEEFFLTLRILFPLVLIWQFLDINYYSQRITLSIKKAIAFGILIFFVTFLLSASVISIFNYLNFVSNEFMIFGAIYVSSWITSAYFEFFIVREKKTLALFSLVSFLMLLVILSTNYLIIPLMNVFQLSLLLFPILMISVLSYRLNF